MGTYRVAKPAWVEGTPGTTPTLSLESVFPGINIDIDLIKNENLHRKSRQSRWLQSALATNIGGWINAANNYGKHADATANQQTSPRQNPRKCQIRQQLPAMHRRTKRAAQQDFVNRLSCVKQTVPRRIYYPTIKLSPTSPINSPSATTTRRADQNSLGMVCGVYL